LGFWRQIETDRPDLNNAGRGQENTNCTETGIENLPTAQFIQTRPETNVIAGRLERRRCGGERIRVLLNRHLRLPG
jgi:hypothetical protein